MANTCSYKVIVKGKRNACYAFFGSMSCMDDKRIVEETGTEELSTIRFEGDCKWSVDSYCTPWEGEFPVVLPEDAEEAREIAEELYGYNTVRERSKMFEVEVWCNSADIDNCSLRFGPSETFEHYINGKDAWGECPVELRITVDYCDDFSIEDGELIKYSGPGGDVVIPDGVTSVGFYAFRDCENLTSVVIPDGVTSIGFRAFKGCKNLASVVIPESVTEIESKAFAGCTKITEFRILNPECKVAVDVFGKRIPKNLNENTADIMGQSLLFRLPKKPSVKECKEVATFMTLFSQKASAEVLCQLYKALKTFKNAAKALTTVEADAALMEKMSK